MRYCPSPSVIADRTFSISTLLAASTVTPGRTAPLESLTVPAIALWAHTDGAEATSTPNTNAAAIVFFASMPLPLLVNFFTGAGAPPPARTDADASPRISMSSARHGRRRFCTGAGAPPPARTDADASPRISMSSARHGRRRFCTGAGAPPPARTDADASPRIYMSSARHGRRRFRVGFRTREAPLTWLRSRGHMPPATWRPSPDGRSSCL